ncbi:hypothetical protein BV25DRAFT_1830544 [Artomyces pyxidatus]|uniref:Uncharacterized protein n=1 Tax=Artomyces pyxidatus TaxID=48021 RepID=A0ACB8SNJ7_9AGAM|nr:hypothetical protein BV25DRAFT_1830544 [Artomyces pyxidatus]
MANLLDLRVVVAALTLLVVFQGTYHSIQNSTYLDTSNPLLTSLPHPLSGTHYFASKKNPLNTIFLKRAWGWTTAVFLPLLLTSPPHPPRLRRTAQYILATSTWILFTMWFFGPALLTRLTVASGGECVLHLPGAHGTYVPIPAEYCASRTPVTIASHPHLFPLPVLVDAVGAPEGWTIVPRLRRGHDVSGHVFLLTLSALFLADQLRQSFKAPTWSRAHAYAASATSALVSLWLFSLWVTSVYFHSPLEKASGYLLGVACFAVVQLPIWLSHKFAAQSKN